MSAELVEACRVVGCQCCSCEKWRANYACCTLRCHQDVHCPDSPFFQEDYVCPDYTPREEAAENAT